MFIKTITRQPSGKVNLRILRGKRHKNFDFKKTFPMLVCQGEAVIQKDFDKEAYLKLIRERKLSLRIL